MNDSVDDKPTGDLEDSLESAVFGVEPLRVSTDDASAVPDPCEVIVEELITVMVEGVGSFALMCTPCDVEALAIGFAFSEGVISSFDDVIDYSYTPDQQVVAMRVEDPDQSVPSRNLIVTSSCGMCGSRNIDKLLGGQVKCADSLSITPASLRSVMEQMHKRQRLFTRTGGTHAAGVFTAESELITLSEDLGRHNALDKAIGLCLMQERSPAGCGVTLSGRISMELVAKAARAGIEIMAAVSAPSSMAVAAADKCNITLCGFVRSDRATIYTHPHRISGLS